MKLLHVDVSPKGAKSNSRALSRYFVERLQAHSPEMQVDYLDLEQHPVSHVTGEFAQATYTPEDQRTPRMKAVLADSDRLCEQLLNADALLFAMPMYNWSMPSAFKAYIDAIIRTNLTYHFDEQQNVIGNLTRQKALFITTRGASLQPGSPYAGMDALTPALRAAFGFIGIQAPQFVNAEPLAFADQAAREAGLAQAYRDLDGVVAQWAGSVVTA
ncbi:NAD(P)H-dependent oxidoreductase [Erwiniaceae bacterium L1_54_6]|jgi:FMN-dependent NADH-azoreductase|nr:NAD(P)H-dependent oxidoreductase [Erwiniaceae bacterium L1_54_6]